MSSLPSSYKGQNVDYYIQKSNSCDVAQPTVITNILPCMCVSIRCSRLLCTAAESVGYRVRVQRKGYFG